jgi:hypothetical protein
VVLLLDVGEKITIKGGTIVPPFFIACVKTVGALCSLTSSLKMAKNMG